MQHHQAVQLWTFRRELVRDPLKVFQTLRTLGHTNVELAGTGLHPPSDFASMLNDQGLNVVGTHQPPLTAAPVERLIDEMLFHCDLFDCHLVTVMSNPRQLNWSEYYQRARDILSRLGDALRSHGRTLCYHPYHFDFKSLPGSSDARCGMDILSELPPSILQFELDIFWLYKAKKDLSFVATFCQDRIPIVHVNDIDESGNQAPLGKGEVPWTTVLRGLHSLGGNWLTIEHDSPEPTDWVRESTSYLRNLLGRLTNV